VKKQATDLIGPIWQDLRAKKLWPVALGLLVAIVAVPVVLTTSSSAPSTGASGSPVAGLPTSGLPAVSQSTGSGGAVKGSAHDPFAPQPGTGGTTTTAGSGSGGSSSSSSSGSSGSTGGTSTTGGGSPGSSSTGGSGTTTTPSGKPVPPGRKPKPPVPSLTASQAYGVSLAITKPNGGINTIDPLERLSLLPSQDQPLLVELGVLKGGSRVLFAVQQGTFVSGPGSCVPGPIDCQILFLGQEQTETVGIQTANGRVPEALFAVTGITAVNYGSASGAMKARLAASSAGRSVLNHSSLSALSLFRYEPSLGAVVDLRNLTVGGS
jgi:hypothetical protein